MSTQVELREEAFEQFQEEFTKKIGEFQYTSGRKVLERLTKDPEKKDKQVQVSASQLDKKIEEDMKNLTDQLKDAQAQKIE